MKNLSTLRSQALFWTYLNDKAILKSNEETVLELKEEKYGSASFSLDGTDYRLRNVGFWTPKTVIETKGERLVTFKRDFFGNKGIVQFASGKEYVCSVSNTPLATFTFLTQDGNEVVQYKMESCLDSDIVKSTMTVFPSSIPDEELLMLIVLGCFAFKAVTEESGGADLIVLVAGA